MADSMVLGFAHFRANLSLLTQIPLSVTFPADSAIWNSLGACDERLFHSVSLFNLKLEVVHTWCQECWYDCDCDYCVTDIIQHLKLLHPFMDVVQISMLPIVTNESGIIWCLYSVWFSTLVIVDPTRFWFCLSTKRDGGEVNIVGYRQCGLALVNSRTLGVCKGS